ncbi:MAG: right-handed parallel beta-helix repeat-containing protein [Paludibacteraceae bacterium]|nr:right-handed parallel beta-helix repeat-containing protein [Paludibacteraceae bacterium]
MGALENSDLPAAGTVLYVTPDGAGKRDGSSWDNAIAGNTVYAMNSGLSAHVAAQGDMLDEANGTTRLINATTGKPVLTTDNRYQGGFARAYITASTSGGTSVSNRSKIWTTEVNVYYDGEREGERDTLQNDKLSESEITTVTSAGSATPGFTAGWYDVSLYPYGEISGQSRALWRAEGNLSPMHENNVTGNGNNFSFNDDYTGAKTAVGMVTSGSLVIRNERYENYISGLQYAVEKASALNKTNHDTKVQVWVGAGKYTDYKGYVMRDSVSVYGGFPASVYAAPGLSERVALMADSSTVIVPKSADHAQLTARNYETILQISDVNPKKDSVTLNTDSVRFWDDNYSVANTEQTINYEYKNRSIVHHYHQVRESGSDIVRTYIQYPDFKNASNENITVSNSSNTTVNSVKYYTFGTATDGFDCWHLSHPVKTNYVANIETGDNVKNKTVNIYDPVTETQLTGTDATFTGHRLFVGNGSLTGLRVWQTIPNLPAGRYKLQIDMAGGYRNKFTDSAPTNMFFRIYDSDGNSCMVAANGQSATEVMLKSIGTVVPTDNSGTVRSAHFRYELEFVQANDGELKIQLEIEDGVRNTKAANSTYGTDTGGDPENIPSSYTSNYGGSNPNRREFFMNNLHLFKLSDDMVYVEYDTNDTLSDRDVPDKKTTDTVSQSVYTVTKHRTTLRKRVLTMPDVTNPVFVIGPGNPVNEGQNGGEVAHIERVIKPERKSWGTNSSRLYDDPNYKEYNEVYWNGFTIRHGFIYDHSSVHDGGAGVSMYEGAHLQNCIITDNFAGCTKQKGGGVFCNGSNATIEGCFILNNTTTQGSSTVSADNQRQEFAGGLFLYEGTCFNSLIANNYANGFGGLGLCVGRFYNNTVAYNRGNATAVSSGNGYPTGDVGKKVGGVRIATNAGTQLLMANTLIYGNNGLAVDITENTSDAAPFINCYVQSEDSILKTAFLGALGNSDEGVANAYGISNVVLNGVAPSAANTPFAADVVNGAYTAGARAANDFSLRQADGIRCVNAGTEDFVSAMTDAVTAYKRYSNHKASNDTEFMNAVAGVTLPQNDVVYADRVQDCQVDIGAYEYNAASDIRPDTLTHPGTAIYYVSFESPGGNASADHPQNAACKQKLQKVLDAAGRYKNSLMLLPRYSTVKDTAKAGKPDKSWMVEVWLEGDDMSSQTSDDYTAGEWYTPTRSTKHNEKNYHDNTLDYSFIVPHGVHLRGGYTGDFYHYEKDGAIVAEGTEGAHIVDERDPLTNRTVLSGRITSSTGAEGQCFHVVTFTNDLFTPEEDLYKGDDEEPIRGSLAYMSRLADSEKHRAVVDGLFIEDGYANSPDLEDRIGAGAVVTGYAHVRNCVVQNNVAMEYGGGLYLKPNALVSGTIIKKNTADVGGGMYVEAPAAQSTDSLAHIYTSTICENLARTTAGGMWFENTYARINSTVLWHNNANDYANISGNFSPTSGSEYPFSYSAVESRRIEGQANVELSARETEGVRWDRQDPFNALLYYPIEMSSTLARAGMTYTEWEKTRALYPTLDTIDIAGVHWAAWRVRGVERKFGWGTDTLVIKKNDFIEIGARVLNKTFEVSVDEKYVMHRLYVMNSDLLNSEAARALQDNILTNDTANMYRQMGSCILNPFHRLGDAFDYIINARKTNPEAYRNTVFEVYIEQGTYYPYHNAYGEQGQVRNNTFLVPEGIYVIGGINSRREDHHYGQEGYYDQFTGQWYGTEDNVDVRVKLPSGAATSYRIYSSSLDSIRLRDDNHRPMRDINQNSVIEPWELDRQTILSGNAVSGEDFTHVYHVITMHADSTYVGPQPLKFTKMNEEYDSNATEPQKGVPMFLKKDAIAMTDTANFAKEIDLSILGRTTEFDGIQINGGYANHLDAGDTVNHRYVTKTYFRGGGIFVDGNWTKSYDSLDEQQPNVTQPAKYNIPIVVENCYFTNNMAGTGGALYSNGGIYMFGCHFTQNYSQGPVTQLDQRYIPWTAGGCIATNATCNISNTLFDNNEARRGLYRIDVTSEDSVPDADARQGFGGVISASQTSRLRVINCHFMRNKAVAYPSIYNFFANNHYHKTDSMNFAFNTIFWGNEVFEMDSVRSIGNLEHADDGPSDESIAAFNLKYRRSRAGVFHYDGTMWDRYEKLYHEYDSLYYVHFAAKDTFHVDVTNKLKELRQVGDSMEGLYFCSYRRGYGPTGMKPNQDGYLMTREEHRRYKDSRQTPVRIRRDENGDYVENYDSLFTYVHGNNNVLINRVNNAIDGPNFVQPTLVAGIDGYMQNADWLLARMNQTTDQGWGHLRQEVTREVSYYITKYTGTTHYDLASEALRAAQAINSEATAKDVYPVRGLPSATFLATEDAAHPEYMSMYNFLSRRYGAYMSHSNPPMPLRDDYYMAYSRGVNEDATSGNMLRISKNPKVGETDVYIDMGIYEYQYVQLNIKGQEIDTMWVATSEKSAGHDGLSWETPTTDLQTAIDILMSSHNNHDKYVCLLSKDGEAFSPTNVLDNRRAFVITSNSLSPLLPDSAEADKDYAVSSLTFLGGYKYDVKERDPYANPTVMEMPNDINRLQTNQLVVVENMTRQMLQANWRGESVAPDSIAIPITFDGITFINPYSTKDPESDLPVHSTGAMSKSGGAAIYYRLQRQYEREYGSDVYNPDFNMALRSDSTLIDGKVKEIPKLTISNCIFMNNGARTEIQEERSPAVRIEHGGGSSLIVNSLFHSNAGAPVYAPTYENVTGENNLALVPNNVMIVNSTFALNDGHITLESDSSQIHNSIIWQDDLGNDTTIQLVLNTHQWDKAANNTQPGIENLMTNNAVWGCFRAGDPTCHNDMLVTANNDVFDGPCFENPDVDATIPSEWQARSFRLNPSMKTMNMADTAVYRDHVFFRHYPDTAPGEKLYWRRANGFKTGAVYSLANDSDLASKPRLLGSGMERGAYECQAVLQRVLYVDPAVSAVQAGNGSSWEHAFGQGQLQNAVNVAAIYTYLNHNAGDIRSRRSYVFVKGSYDAQADEHIVPHDGVQLYGSIATGFLDTAYLNPETGYTDAECERYVNQVRATRAGVAAPNTATTRLSSVRTNEGAAPFATGFLLDGFVVSNPGETTDEAPLSMADPLIVVRNCVVTGNTRAAAGSAPRRLGADNDIEDDFLSGGSGNNPGDPGAPSDYTEPETDAVVRITGGLFYNNLVYDNTAPADIFVRGSRSLLLNNTVANANSGQRNLVVQHGSANSVVNCLFLNEADDAVAVSSDTEGALSNCNTLTGMFAPYMSDGNAYTLPAYLTQYRPLRYQLHERSRYIDAADTSRTALAALNGGFSSHIGYGVDFSRDLDVMANPRVTEGRIDLGCFETWRVPASRTAYATTLTNPLEGNSGREEAVQRAAYTTNYGGNRYPHGGSVVYLMENANLVLETDGAEPCFSETGENPFRPGYLLLEEGASLYGHGNDVQLSYVAACRRFSDQQYAMMAFPFRNHPDSVVSVAFDASADRLTQQLNPVPFSRFTYDGTARAAHNYRFAEELSSCWQPATAVPAATEGWLLRFDAAQDTLLRFTGWGAKAGQYVYTEDNSDYKTVTLTQYDHRTAGKNGSGLNFTRAEDMGWNLKGQPWLVGSFKTYEQENWLYTMNIPHLFYKMKADGDYDYADFSNDQIFTSRSWDSPSAVALGESFFTQTATLGASEPLRFLRPVKSSAPAPAPVRPLVMLKSAYGQADLLDVYPDAEADTVVTYRMGRDGIKWQTLAAVPQLWLSDSRLSTRLSLLGAAPVETDLQLGISIPARDSIADNASSGSLYTFSLPEPEAFAGYDYVWLIDRKLNRYVNLLDKEYGVVLPAGMDNSRFQLRIGGFPNVKDGKRQYVIFVHEGVLYVRGLVRGDRITLFGPDGRLVLSATAEDSEYQTPLHYQSGYVVRVNDYGQKVLNL